MMMRKSVICNMPVVYHLTGKPKSSASSLSRCFNILGKTTTLRRVYCSFRDCTKFGSSTSILSLPTTSMLLLPRQLSSAYPSLVVTRYKTKETIPVLSLRVAAAAAEDDTKVRVHFSEEGNKAWHMGGSKDQKPERRDEKDIPIKRFRSHKHQWIGETGKEWPSTCCTKGCNDEATVGAHVVLDRKDKVHLVPFCKSCNSSFTHNWIPEYDENNRTGLELDVGTPCLELNHISKHESRTITEVVPWKDMYDKLKIHYAETKTTLGPYMDDELKRWVSNQRTRYQKKVHTMLPYRVTLLEAINFEWYLLDAQWEEYFALLVIYAKRESHCNVPKRHQEDGMKLGKWLDNQRQIRKKEKLDPDREKRLNELGVEWNPLIAQWEGYFSLLVIYAKRESHCNVPKRHQEDGMKLGTWLDNQRQTKKKEKLNPDREKRLDELGVEWNPSLTARWEAFFPLLVQFKRKYGHCNVQFGYTTIDGQQLGWWLDHQRQTRKKRKLDPDKEKRLDDTGVEWDPSATQWEK